MGIPLFHMFFVGYCVRASIDHFGEERYFNAWGLVLMAILNAIMIGVQ